MKHVGCDLLFCVLVAIGLVATTFIGPSLQVESSEFPYKKTALVTAAYFFLFYLAIFYQSMVAIRVWGEKSSSSKSTKVTLWEIKYGPSSYKDRRIVSANRTVGNMLEQMPIFLSGLWLVAILTSDDTHASMCGWVYVAFRSIYPMLYIYNPNLILITTIPNYCVVAYLWVTIVRACIV